LTWRIYSVAAPQADKAGERSSYKPVGPAITHRAREYGVDLVGHRSGFIVTPALFRRDRTDSNHPLFTAIVSHSETGAFNFSVGALEGKKPLVAHGRDSLKVQQLWTQCLTPRRHRQGSEAGLTQAAAADALPFDRVLNCTSGKTCFPIAALVFGWIVMKTFAELNFPGG